MASDDVHNNNPEKFKVKDRSHKASKLLCHPPEGEDIVITGMAGKFPESDDVQQFGENLFNKVDLISGDNRRWKPTNSEVPQRTGKLNDISVFDAGFFGIRNRHSNNMDVYVRMMLERTYETIVDAGYHPSELRGTKTGVFLAASYSESENYILQHKHAVNSDSVPGVIRSAIAHHVSYFFRFQGPSYITDSACSSSLYAIEHAYRNIREGFCDMAVVGGLNLCLNPNVSLSFARLGVLSPDGRCKTFDHNADGYVRSEIISALFLQKSKDARRIYAHILHSKLNCDGYKEQGVAHPSSEMQTVLMKEVYSECDVELSDVSFVEVHGTGTKVGDLQELNALTNVFCRGREKPLYIGAVKSNAGHSEPGAGTLSIIKVILGMERGFIPPNLHFSKPREDVEALVKGQLKVIDEKTPWPNNKGIAGVNSLGVGGANGHLVLRWNEKRKANMGIPVDDLPRLVCASGRTKEAVVVILDDLSGRRLDAEFVSLLHAVFKERTLDHPFRGHQILSKDGGELDRSVYEVVGNKRKLAWVFNNFDSNWHKFGKELMAFPAFVETLKTVQNVTTGIFDVNIIDVLGKFEPETAVNQILATMATQLCLASVLKTVGLIPDFLIGLGTGELIVAYLEDSLTLEQVIRAHLSIDIAFNNNKSNSPIREELLIKFEKLKLNGNFCPLRHSANTHSYKQGSAEPFGLDETKGLQISGWDALVIGGRIKNFEHLSLIRDDSQDPVLDFLRALGRFYGKGHDLHLNNLYPSVTWPVSRGTPMISPLIKWDHTQKWYVVFQEKEARAQCIVQHMTRIDIKSKDWNFITGHDIDGRVLFPAAAFLYLVWETLAKIKGKATSEMKIIFEDVKFLQHINLTNEDDVQLLVTISKGDNTFEITERDDLIAMGVVYERFEDFEDLPTMENSKKDITLTQIEVYKTLRLRGYNYKGEFKSIRCAIGNARGLISWAGNWTTFMDNMLQMLILKEDTRSLYVPTSIEQIIIDPAVHSKFTDGGEDPETLVPVDLYHRLGVIRSGGIQFRHVKVNSIARRKQAEPVLEIYKFVPNVTALSLEESVRVALQIILENKRSTKFKSVEIEGSSPLISPLIKRALDDHLSVQADVVVLSKNSPNLPGISVEDKRRLYEVEGLLVVVPRDALKNTEILYEALKAVKGAGGFVLLRESLNFDVLGGVPGGLDVFCVHTTDSETLVLLRQSRDYKQPILINASNDAVWLPTAQDAIKRGQPLIFFSQNRYSDGILGLVNCLRKEPNGDCVSCFSTMDEAPEFDLNRPFYERQFRKNMTVNVWKDGKWGTYRHLPLKENAMVQCAYCYAKAIIPGDLSSIKFIEGSPCDPYKLDGKLQMVHIYWSALNFRDVLIATGRIPIEIAAKNRSEQEYVLGVEFSGRDITGKRVMGLKGTGALATHVVTNSLIVWTIPDQWSLEEAATVPGVYLTVIYAFLMKGRLKPGQSVLIHLGAGGVGQAAINIALHFDCTIFVTAGTQEKRDFLRRQYPQIKKNHIGNSRDGSFEQMVLLETEGRGVDVILNSLSEGKLRASLRCLARNGVFLEIGKFDMEKDNKLELELFEKGASFQSVMLDFLFSSEGKLELKQQLLGYFADLLRKGVVKPLPRTVFKREEVADAFKFMSTGEHIGKVLVNIRSEEETPICSVENDRLFAGFPRYYCDSGCTYVIIGGLGGFGLELVDWLILKGARKFVLGSRTGLKTGYQAMLLRNWQESGVQVFIRTDDVTTKEGCVELIGLANHHGPVKAIFNLAAVLVDVPFEMQTVENFEITMGPKALVTQNLDTISRIMCPRLSHFVVFSSVSCGKGNVEQSNYGMANSVMERICEKRREDGFPALAIQWGCIGDVGVLMEMQESTNSEIIIAGMRQQSISSCLQVLDSFLRQEETIVSSMIVDHKCPVFEDSIVDRILNILDITDAETRNSYLTFAELGMDSIMTSEIKQILERELELFLTSQDIRAMSAAKLQDMVKGKDVDPVLTLKKEEDEDFESIRRLLHLTEEVSSSIEPIVRMSNSTEDDAIKIYVLPGFEGSVTPMKPLIRLLNANAFCVQYHPQIFRHTIEEWAESILQYVDVNCDSFVLVSYSFGCVVATELAYLLEKSGRRGKLVFIDGAPNMLMPTYRKLFGSEGEEFLETNAVCMYYMMMRLPTQEILKRKGEMLRCKSLEDRIRVCLSMVPKSNSSDKSLFDASVQCCRQLKAVLSYTPKFPKLKSKVKLIKPKHLSVSGLAEDYELSSLFERVEKVEKFEGSHLDILDNVEVAHSINAFLWQD